MPWHHNQFRFSPRYLWGSAIAQRARSACSASPLGDIEAADSRTNAGVDYISTYRKLFDFSLPGERVIILCTSGNLSITQAVIAGLRKDIKVQQEVNLHNIPTMYEIARYIGGKIRQILEQDRTWLQQDGIYGSS